MVVGAADPVGGSTVAGGAIRRSPFLLRPNRMKAVVTQDPGPQSTLEIVERPTPSPGPDEIRVAVAASALNRADLLQRMGRYPPPPGAPLDVCGLEYAGVVDAVGERVTLWEKGDRVMGIIGGGAHSEAVVVHEREAMPVPKSLDLTEAAAIPEAFLTAWDALFLQLDLRVGEKVLIHAVGSGVGTAAIQLARLAGAETFGTSRTEGKLERATELGLEHAIVGGGADWPAEVLDIAAGGVDAVMDLVGGDYTEGNLRCIAARGRILVVGLVAGAQTPLDLGRLLSRRASIAGTVLRSRPIEEKISLAQKFVADILPSFASGRLRPIVHSVLPMGQAEEAYRRMSDNDTFGKLVLEW